MAREVGIDMGKQTFDLDLFCLNCGNRWEAMIPVGYDFFGFTTNTAVWEACYGTPSYYGNKPRTGYTVVSCPVCESARVERATNLEITAGHRAGLVQEVTDTVIERIKQESITAMRQGRIKDSVRLYNQAWEMERAGRTSQQEERHESERENI